MVMTDSNRRKTAKVDIGMVKTAPVPNAPLVTVITATFNAAKLLPETVNSLRQQEFTNFEWLVIDGGSTDGTVEILQQSEDVVDYWISEPDQGIYDAWNKGVLAACGEWLVFLGAGDVYKPDAISTYVRSLMASETIPDFISSRVHLIDDNKKILRLYGRPFVWDEFRKSMDFAHVGAFHNKSLFERYGLFDIAYKSSGDYDFFMRCGKHLSARFIDVVTAEVLVGGISLNHSTGLNETCSIQIKYGKNPLIAKLNNYVARIKQKFRPLIRGY